MQDTAEAPATSEDALFDSHFESSPPDLARLGVAGIWRGCLIFGKGLSSWWGDLRGACLQLQKNEQGSGFSAWKIGE